MTQKKHAASAWKDPIVEEVRAAREKLFTASGHDLAGFVARLRERQHERGGVSVSYSKRAPSKEPAR